MHNPAAGHGDAAGVGEGMGRVIGYVWTYCLWCGSYQHHGIYASWLGERCVCDGCHHDTSERPEPTDDDLRAFAAAEQDSRELAAEVGSGPWPR